MRLLPEGLLWILFAAAGIALSWVSATYGAWYVLFLVGLVVGLLPQQPGGRALLAVVIALGGWGLPLLWMSFFYNLHSATGVISATMGFGSGSGWAVDVLTLVVALLLAVAGTWLGKAVRDLFVPQREASIFRTGRHRSM